jgi:hypothetical protein
MTHSVEVNTPLEALLAEQALAMVRELGSAAAAGPDGERGLLAAVGAAGCGFFATVGSGRRGGVDLAWGGSAVPRGVGSVGPFHALEHAAAAAKGRRRTTWWVTSPSTPSDWRSLRLAASGAVEGLTRRMGDRLKTPGRGWREDHLDPTATLVNLVQTTKWPELCKPSVN